MTRGAKPKVYDSELVENVRQLYSAGHTQDEVGALLGISQKVIWKLMLRHQITARIAAKRNQYGARNTMWKGDTATYAAFHLRVQQQRGTPSVCGQCGTTKSPRFEWASLTKNYADVQDYVRLCCSCHHRFDGTVRNLGSFAKRKEVSR
jgi:adenylosuccinate lyase